MMQELTEAPGVPGQEGVVRRIMQRYLEPLGEIVTDNLGSIACRKVGSVSDGPVIMMAGHMDEIGFMVTRITEQGFLKFQTLGGWLEHVMLAQRVQVYGRHGPVIGVIGSKPPHVLEPEDRKKLVQRKEMFIDIGASSAEEVESWGIQPSDPIVPVCPFTVMRNEKLLMAKAWDNRFGCALVLAVLERIKEEDHPNVVYGVGHVQEEVGLRGATTMSNLIGPDIGFAFDTGIAGDMPGVDPDRARGVLGKGPDIILYDASMIPHRGLRNLVIDTAKEHDIPVQIDCISAGGTDAGRIHLSGHGVPSLTMGIPVRYIHTHASILNIDDFHHAVELVVQVLKRLDAETVQKLKESLAPEA